VHERALFVYKRQAKLHFSRKIFLSAMSMGTFLFMEVFGKFYFENKKRIEKLQSRVLLKIRYPQKNIVIFPLPKKCAVFYPKLCILNFPALGHCRAVRVS
jgi:hypothetical protein